MYTIQRDDGLYLADGPVYINDRLPQPIWQLINGTREIYLEESLWNITNRRDKLQKIYEKTLYVKKLTEEELEYLTFRKLRGY